MAHETTRTRLNVAVPNGGTFAAPYPAGRAAADFDPNGDHVLDSNRYGSLRSPDVSFVFGALQVTVTNSLSRPLAKNTEFLLQLELLSSAEGGGGGGGGEIPGVFDDDEDGLVPATGEGDGGRVLRADGTWGDPSGGGLQEDPQDPLAPDEALVYAGNGFVRGLTQINPLDQLTSKIVTYAATLSIDLGASPLNQSFLCKLGGNAQIGAFTGTKDTLRAGAVGEIILEQDNGTRVWGASPFVAGWRQAHVGTLTDDLQLAQGFAAGEGARTIIRYDVRGIDLAVDGATGSVAIGDTVVGGTSGAQGVVIDQFATGAGALKLRLRQVLLGGVDEDQPFADDEALTVSVGTGDLAAAVNGAAVAAVDYIVVPGPAVS